MSAEPSYRRLPPAERRDQILEAAAGLVATSGFNGVSLDAFAEAAGITKPGLLHHFPSKNDLLLAVLEWRETSAVAAAAESLAETADGPDAARRLLDQIIRYDLDHPHLARLSAILTAESLDPSHPAHDYFNQRHAGAVQHLATQVLSWHSTPVAAATQVLAFVGGLELMWLRDPDVDLLAEWSRFADTLFR